VGAGVAEVGGDGVGTVGVADAAETLHDAVEGLVPADLDELVTDPRQRAAQPVRILGERAQAGRLGADVAAAHHVVLVAADVEHPVRARVDGDRDAAVRLAQVAAAVDDAGLVLAHGGCLRWSLGAETPCYCIRASAWSHRVSCALLGTDGRITADGKL
jgi:hypothetical protein